MSIQQLQRRLQALGVDPGPADGKGGPRTAAALEKDMESRYGVGFSVVPRGHRLVAEGPIPAPAPDEPLGQPAVPVILQGSARYPVREIVVHCAATSPSWMARRSLTEKVAEITRWHVEDRGWRTIGYHHVIDVDGARWPGRPETEIGAGVEGHNRGVIHVCLIGGAGSAATDDFARHFTPAQDASLRSILRDISARTRIQRVSGHNEWAAKACPGFHVPTWFKGGHHG